MRDIKFYLKILIFFPHGHNLENPMKIADWKLRNLELRDYQLNLSEEITQNKRQNYIIWAPVGMGKTIIAYLALVRAHNLGRLMEKKQSS